MQRVIKFRAWDKDNRCFLDNYGKSGWYIDPIDGIQVSSGWDSEDRPTYGEFGEYGRNERYRDQTHFELSQFTGLLDKNGNEIYEGDTVNLIWDCGDYRGKKFGEVYATGEIKFEGGKYYLSRRGEEHDLNLPEPAYPSWFEVIGNIYSNPDLV